VNAERAWLARGGEGNGGEDAGPAAGREFDQASRWAAIVESSTDAITGWSLDGVVTSWNAGAEKMYGYAASEIVGRNVSLVIPADRVGGLPDVLARLRQGERVAFVESTALRKDGSIIDVSFSVSPIRDASGAIAGVSSVARDMTELNRMEAERRALEKQLQEALRLETLARLAGGVAHDFNNLLAVIVSYAGFVAEEVTEPGVRADVEQIQAAAHRGEALTRQLLIFGQREMTQPEALDLNVAVAEIRNLLSTSLGPEVDLRIDVAAAPAVIVADRGQVGQVLLNLAVNARDAMPEGGTLTIGTAFADLDAGYARVHPDVSPGRYVQLTVSDTGTGMSAEVAARIFEPFFTTKPVGQGTGLGLSTVHGIITQASGSVTVESVEGAGATFRIYFPAASAAAPAAHPVPAAGGRGHETTIMIVDDEPAVLAATARILRKNGYATLEAGTHEKALSLAASQDFQLLLTDSVMPGMSGATLAERIAEFRPGVPTLHMSGYSAGTLSADRIREGEVAFIQKPFTAQALLDKVHALLGSAPAE
jgi:two-component system, cell cycle sensor histidine kinase and response regulator CckA